MNPELETLLRISPIAIAALRDDLKPVLWNPAADQVLGLNPRAPYIQELLAWIQSSPPLDGEPREIELAGGQVRQLRIWSNLGHGTRLIMALDVTDELNAAALLLENPGLFHKDPVAAFFPNGLLGKEVLNFQCKAELQKCRSKLGLIIHQVPRAQPLVANILLAINEFSNNSLDASARATKEGFEAEIGICFDQNRLIVVARDNVGSLKPRQLINRFFKTENFGIAKTMNMDERKGGAGIGCRLIFDVCQSLYLAVIPQSFTTVVAVFQLGTSQKNLEALGKSLHISESDGRRSLA